MTCSLRKLYTTKGGCHIITDDIKQEIVTLRARGYSLDKICADLSISKPTAIKYVKELEESIDLYLNLNKEKMSELILAYHEGQRRVVSEIFSSMAEQIKERVDKGELEKIPLDKLINSLARLASLDQGLKIKIEQNLTTSTTKDRGIPDKDIDREFDIFINGYIESKKLAESA